MVKLILLLVACFVSNLKAENTPSNTAEPENSATKSRLGGYLANHPACKKDFLSLAKR